MAASNRGWTPTNKQAERILIDMRVDRLEEIVRDGLGRRPLPLSPTAPIYMRRDNERLIKAHIALTELADRLRDDADAAAEDVE